MTAVLHPLGPGRQILIDRAVVLVGRSPECDAVLDVSSRISRMHCALVQADHAYYIRDLASMNGVWVNGQRVNQECRLTQGATISIGDLLFRFYEKVPAEGLPAPQLPDVRQSPPVSAQGRRRPFPVLIDKTVRSAEDDVFEVEITDDEEFSSPASPAGIGGQGRHVPTVDAEFSDESEGAELIREVDIVHDVEIIESVEEIDDAEITEHPPDSEDSVLIHDVQVLDDPSDDEEFPEDQVKFRRRRRRKRST